ncbi:hypothetical protein DXT91_23915 [Agrobacterium tumefaciens]|nr:hypothetical protein [Agrobacterium tumefaciens]
MTRLAWGIGSGLSPLRLQAPGRLSGPYPPGTAIGKRPARVIGAGFIVRCKPAKSQGDRI